MQIPHVLDVLADAGQPERLEVARGVVRRAADGEIAALDLRGRAGMGKTRLHRAAIDEAARVGVRVVSFRLAPAEAQSEALLPRLLRKIRDAAPDRTVLDDAAIQPETPRDRAFPRPEASESAIS